MPEDASVSCSGVFFVHMNKLVLRGFALALDRHISVVEVQSLRIVGWMSWKAQREVLI